VLSIQTLEQLNEFPKHSLGGPPAPVQLEVQLEVPQLLQRFMEADVNLSTNVPQVGGGGGGGGGPTDSHSVSAQKYTSPAALSIIILPRSAAASQSAAGGAPGVRSD